MDKIAMIGYHIVSACMIFIGAGLFAWFLWPAVFKGMLNTGNCCGMFASAVLLFCGMHAREVYQFFTDIWQKKPMRIIFLLLAALAVAGAVLFAAASAAILGAASKQIPKNTPAVVLGCAVKGSRPSKVLQERIDAAYEYLQEHPQAICVLSGGKGKGEDISEAECMYEQLVQAGIDGSRLYQEAESVNTRENLENSILILKELGAEETVTVISSNFHLYRGRWWADRLGYEHYGYAAHTDWKYFPTLFLREVIAVVHLWLTK